MNHVPGSMAIPFKIVNDGRAKGIIVTAETLYALRKDISLSPESEAKQGAMSVLEFLENAYDKI